MQAYAILFFDFSSLSIPLRASFVFLLHNSKKSCTFAAAKVYG